MQRSIVALLPIKAHSARVSGKNFRTLGDRPLFRWILDTLLALEEIKQIVINTDARSELRQHGLPEHPRVMVRDRKPEICGDLVSMNLVLADDVASVPADIYLMTHATNPFLGRDTLRRAIDRFLSDGTADSLFSVNRLQTRFYRADGSPVNHDPNNLVRTQDLEPWFEENSCLYLFTGQSFATTNARIGRKPLLFEIPKLEAIDIDNPEDWEHAEALAAAGFPRQAAP